MRALILQFCAVNGCCLRASPVSTTAAAHVTKLFQNFIAYSSNRILFQNPFDKNRDFKKMLSSNRSPNGSCLCSRGVAFILCLASLVCMFANWRIQIVCSVCLNSENFSGIFVEFFRYCVLLRAYIT